MFEEIEKVDKKLPSSKEVKKQAKNLVKKYNLYQIIAIFIVVIGIIMGIVVGNSYAVCNSYSNINGLCVAQSFNFGWMFTLWIVASIVGVLISSLGKIIELLTKIDEKCTNMSKKK